MRPLFVRLLAVCLTASVCASTLAGDLYVAKDRGDNTNPGTKEAPFKNLESALKAAQAGDRIHVAQGNYTGLRDKGYLEAPQPVELLGGYAPDFASRDPVRFATTVVPSRVSGESGRKPLLSILNVPAGATFVLDGFIFDRGEQNAYSPKESVIEGIGGRILAPTEKPAEGPSTVDEPLVCFTNKVRSVVEGDLAIRNCVFLNGHFAIQGGFKRGKVRILNNVFAGNKMAAIEVFGTGGKKGPKGPTEQDGQVEIAHNTILFTWSRTKDLGDMGYGARVMTMVSYDIHDNIIGCNTLAGIDHTRGNPNAWLKLDNNIIFLNKQSPLLYVEPGTSAAGKMERVQMENLGADLGFGSCKGNSATTGKLPMNETYFGNFLNARYSESADFNPDSPANVMREVMGMPKQGALTSKVTMWGNRYSMPDALKLFGAVDAKGAQKPSLP